MRHRKSCLVGCLKKSSELGFIIGGEVTTLKGLEEISGIIITEMLINVSENLQKFKDSYDLKNTIKICLMSLELQIICYLTFSMESIVCVKLQKMSPCLSTALSH
ncbi:hypothetical protein Bca101_008146 [Brassica carinata]